MSSEFRAWLARFVETGRNPADLRDPAARNQSPWLPHQAPARARTCHLHTPRSTAERQGSHPARAQDRVGQRGVRSAAGREKELCLYPRHPHGQRSGTSVLIAQPPRAKLAAAFLHCRGTRPNRWKIRSRSEEHTSELQSHSDLVCRLLLEK